MSLLYSCPAEKMRAGPMTPQIIDAVPKTVVFGQLKPSFWCGEQMPSMLLNTQDCTPSCTVPATAVARTWHQNIGRGLCRP